MFSSQTPISIPPGLFGSNPYDPLQPFLAAAAAAAEANHQPSHLHTYSAYYDAVTREATQQLALHPHASSLAAALICSSNNGTLPHSFAHHHQDEDFRCSDPNIPHMPNVVYNLPCTPCFPAMEDSFANCSDSISYAGQPVPRRGMKNKKREKAHSTNKTHNARLAQSWPCNCACAPDDDSLSTSGNSSRHNADCNSPMNTSSSHGPLSIAADSYNDGTVPPFECAKSFIRRRNARERERVRCVNAGYESLRKRLPMTHIPDRRLAKVEILRGAITYIKTLRDLLEK